ncbi:MAG TPA: DHHA2 domain-containing protein, partial [Ktedonobacteraceae bacterium]|nr:DHHA2 domain-containing protein [Ktedonobacteraceae bacterium]
LAQIAGEEIEQYGQEIFAAAAADQNGRSAEALITADFKEFTVGDTKFAIGTVETASPAAIEKRTPELLSAMQRIAHERGYASLLFMLVDIIDMECRLMIWGGERAVAGVLGAALESDGHTVVVEGLVSRKKQLVPLLARFQAAMSGKTGIL